MTFGLKAYGDAGNVQIDQNSVTMAFLAKGSITLNQELKHLSGSGTFGPYFENAWRNNLNLAASGGLLCAFRPRYASRPVGVWQAFAGGSSTEFVGYSSDSTPPIVDYWIFGNPAASTTQFGAEVYGPGGSRVWSAAGRPMKIAAVKNDVYTSAAAVDAGVAGDWAVCVGDVLGGVRSGTETTLPASEYAWLESRAMWSTPTSTGFAAPGTYPALRLQSFSYPTGWRETDIRATVLLVDVAGL